MRRAIVFMCLALMSWPAMAADDEGGWFVGLEATSLQPTGGINNGFFVLDDPDFDFVPEGRLRAVEFDNEIAPRLIVGWMNDEGSGFFLTYWNWDDDARAFVSRPSTGTGSLWDTIYHPDESFDEFQGTASAFSNVDATVIDFAYGAPLKQSDKFNARWSVGIRSAEHEQMTHVEFFDEFSTETVDLVSDMSGVGLVGGINGMIPLGKKVFVYGGVSYALLQGDIEHRTLMMEVGDTDPDADIRGKVDRTFSIMDTNLGVAWNVAAGLHLWLGWEQSNWSNAVDTVLFPDDVNEGFTTVSTTDVNWSGFTFGAGYKF